MSLTEFQAFVEQHKDQYQGAAHETPESIAISEGRVGLSLPTTLKWLLTEYGYGFAVAVPNLEEAIDDTLRLREVLRLPLNILFLCDWNDVGVVWIDINDSAGGGTVYWGSTEVFEELCAGNSLGADVDIYEDFASWAISALVNGIRNEVQTKMYEYLVKTVSGSSASEPVGQHEKAARGDMLRAAFGFNLATTYFPGRLLHKYLWRWRA